MKRDDFLQALAQPGEEAPCDRFSCGRRSECASALLACEAFGYFVRSGHAIHPAMTWVDAHGVRRQKPQLGDAAKPSAAEYSRVFSDEAAM